MNEEEAREEGKREGRATRDWRISLGEATHSVSQKLSEIWMKELQYAKEKEQQTENEESRQHWRRHQALLRGMLLTLD